MRKLLTACLAFLFSAGLLAQPTLISGYVKDSKGDPVPFANVKIKGKKDGTAADVNGFFSIRASTGDVLVVSATEMETTFFSITNTEKIEIHVERKSAAMTEVVVTALGIKRKADNLSYATQGVKGDRLTVTRMTDMNTAMAGKLAGVQVRTQPSAKLGSSSTIRLRGANSLTDKNPLYVFDGTPIDDISAINMDDVDNIQVLKGPAATALYGQRAESGVIMITSRKARKKTGVGIEVKSSMVLNTIGILPKYQNEYAGGTPGADWQTYNWAPGDPDEWKALDGKKYHTYYDDASWGPRMDGSEYIPWYAWFPGTNYSFKTASLVPQKKNIREFYDKGVQWINGISLTKAGDNFNTRFSYTNQDETGLIPYSWLKKNSLSSQTVIDLSKHFTLNANINFVNQRVRGDFDDKYANNSSGSFNQWFHRDLDMGILKELKDLRTPTGRLPGWNLDDVNGISKDALYSGTLYWTNPFSYYQNAYAVNKTNRLFGDVGLTYKLNSHFKIAGFLRRNQRNSTYESFMPVIFEVSTSDMSSPLSVNEQTTTTMDGRPVRATYRSYSAEQIENNYEFLSSYNDKFGRLELDFNAGGNIRQNTYNYLEAATKGGLVIPDLFTLANSKVQPFWYSNTREKKIVRSIYGRGSLNYDDLAILDFSVRNDWSSALPPNANSYMYPSIGTSFILTRFIKPSVHFVSFAKVRASWAQIGSDLDPYSLTLNYAPGANQWNGNMLMTTPDRLLDPNIKPSLSSSYEGGVDLRFLNNRISFSGTYYKERKLDEIIPVTITAASGFSSKLVNAAEIQRSGVELTLEGLLIDHKSFQWDVTLNWAKNTSKVKDIYPGIDVIYSTGSDYSNTTGAAAYAPGVWHVKGGEWGQLRGRGIKRIDGKPVISANGLYAYEDNVNFGTILPDFTGGIANQLTYKNVTLNFVIDYLKGGKYFSLSDHWGGFSGLYDYTAGLNDKGKPVRDPVADGGGVHVVGVDNNKNPVDRYIDAIDYYQGNGVNRINEMHIFKLDYIKLREVSIGYKLPLQKLAALSKYIQSVSINAFARNPWLIYADNRNFDPSELVGAYGESGQLPPSRSYGLTINVGF